VQRLVEPNTAELKPSSSKLSGTTLFSLWGRTGLSEQVSPSIHPLFPLLVILRITRSHEPTLHGYSNASTGLGDGANDGIRDLRRSETEPEQERATEHPKETIGSRTHCYRFLQPLAVFNYEHRRVYCYRYDD